MRRRCTVQGAGGPARLPIGRPPRQASNMETTMFKKRALLLAALLVATALGFSFMATGPSPAETYPTRAVHFIVPFPGGPSDILARLFAQKLSEHWQQP